MRLAAFVSPHGFGHAARASALLAAWRELDPALEVTLWTTVPRWFFAESLGFGFRYRELACDVGLAQTSAVEEDLPVTLQRLEEFWTETRGFHFGDLVSGLREARAEAVLCDISPLGLLLAKEVGLPSILVENFTWDWLYAGYFSAEPRFAPWIERLRALFALADLRIQAEPVCAPLDGAVRVPPMARRPRATPAAVRARLGIAPRKAMVLVSFGGVATPLAGLARCGELPEVEFVVPGGAEREARRGNLVLLPHHTPIHHPDLVAAADVVVGKLGYSTVAEALAAGARYAFVARPRFRESAVLERYVRARLPWVELAAEELASGAWVERLPALLAEPRPAPRAGGGAAAGARAARSFLASRSG